jgi:hypothetical protein
VPISAVIVKRENNGTGLLAAAKPIRQGLTWEKAELKAELAEDGVTGESAV